MFNSDGTLFSSLSTKQAGVIFRNWKLGNIDLEEQTIKDVYKFANDSISIYSDRDVIERCEDDFFEAVKCLFNGEYKKAEQLIKSATYSRYHAKYSKHYSYDSMMEELNKEEE